MKGRSVKNCKPADGESKKKFKNTKRLLNGFLTLFLYNHSHSSHRNDDMKEWELNQK